MNVRTYFESRFPGHAYVTGDDAGDLESMPLDCECGSDCKRAIDAGSKLLPSIAMAFGKGEDSHPKGHAARQAIGAAVVNVCICFICG